MSGIGDNAPAATCVNASVSSWQHPDAPHVVLVDDDDDILDVLDIIFADDGFRTTRCSTYQAALGALCSERTDLLVTDLRLGGEDGLELIRAVQTLPAEVPSVILLTAARMSVLEAVKPLFHSVGAEIVTKPFDIDHLLAVARSMIGWPGRA